MKPHWIIRKFLVSIIILTIFTLILHFIVVYILKRKMRTGYYHSDLSK